MTFEPLIRHTIFEEGLVNFIWAFSVCLVFTCTAYILAKKSKDVKSTVITIAACSFVITFAAVGMVTSTYKDTVNKDRVKANIMKKYDVEAFSFVRTRSIFPEQTTAQEVRVKAHGVTSTVWLVQDPQSSEPTLLNYDSGEPDKDLLRSK